MPEEALAAENKQAGGKKTKEPALRFPLVEPKTAEFTMRLPPFPTAPEGFSGSLDELLGRLRAEALPLAVLPLAPLVDQYLGYCERLVEQEDPHERMSDFLPLAATLIHLKSRLLLPKEKPLPSGQPTVEDEIVEEIRREERRRREERAASEAVEVVENGPGRLTLLDLMVLLNDVQNSLRAPLSLREEDLSVREAIRWIRTSLPGNACLDAETYFALCATRRDQAAVFLAVLELGKCQAITCHQRETFAPIWLCRTAESASSTTAPL
jgi:segregation and condensation protein A